jgi:hypothetical protein
VSESPVVNHSNNSGSSDSLSHEDNEETAGIAPMPEPHLYAGIAVENKAEDASDDFNVVIISSPFVGSGKFFSMLCNLIN